MHKKPEPRSTDEIFGDLRTLAQSDGALHEISAIIYRDWVVTVDMQEARVTDDPEHRWSILKLNKNEIMLLLGLAVQAAKNHTYSVLPNTEGFADRADALMREFHDRVLVGCAPTVDEESGTVSLPESIGPLAREAIYYGAEGFYLHQFRKFSRLRYRNDGTWLLQNIGLSIRPMIDIAVFITDRINNQMTSVGHMRKEGREFTPGELTNSLLVSKAEVQKKFGQKTDAFLAKFTTPATGANTGFTNPFEINEVAIAPIIDLGEYLYVPNQYRLFETIYESPFYWMMADLSYCDTLAENRGDFLENSAAHIFRAVFGAENVYENVTLRERSKDIAGEVDVLVVYGEFVLVVQAKSKRITLKARAGDEEALNTDFKGAIQAPYRQALECLKLIRNGAACFTKEGNALTLSPLSRLFPIVILSDSFPASTFLSHAMLERSDNIAPVIWDLGILDVVARLLPTPIEMIYFLKCRSEVFDRVSSDSEYNFLGYHISAKLALPDDVDWMTLDRDFASVVDDYMIAADLSLDADRPLGVLERLQIPVVTELLAEFKTADPRIASVVVDLYDFSSKALENFSGTIISLREEIATTGKAIKAFSIPTETGGLTYAVTRSLDARGAEAAKAIGTKHKYDTKSDRWYVILDSIETINPVDGLLMLVWPWQHNDAELENSERIGEIFNSHQVPSSVGDAVE